MSVTARKRIASIFLLLAFVLFGASRVHATPIPPQSVELTRAEMERRQFTFKLRRYDARSSIELRFPTRLLANDFWLVPSLTKVLIKNKAGDVIASTEHWVANSEVLSIDASYNHGTSDSSVSITYACAKTSENGCYGAITFSIPSVSKFIDANRDSVNLPPKCKKVPSTTIEIFDCTQ